jgi:hypothetical protein
MAEERNRNWEVALARLSAALLDYAMQLGRRDRGPIPTEIGPLVGEALHLIGAQLVNDLESDSESTENALTAGDVSVGDASSQPEATI